MSERWKETWERKERKDMSSVEKKLSNKIWNDFCFPDWDVSGLAALSRYERWGNCCLDAFIKSYDNSLSPTDRGKQMKQLWGRSSRQSCSGCKFYLRPIYCGCITSPLNIHARTALRITNSSHVMSDIRLSWVTLTEMWIVARRSECFWSCWSPGIFIHNSLWSSVKLLEKQNIQWRVVL